jgi:hypothetical protein
MADRIETRVGDEVVVEAPHQGAGPRKGEILEVLVENGRERYRVRWDDTGHETLFFPGPTTSIVHMGGGGEHASPA